MTAPNEIYQYSIISSLAQGICADGLPVMQLLSKGDHGLGALAGLDGEVTIIDGHVYQFTSSGGARALEPSDVTPFLNDHLFPTHEKRHHPSSLQRRSFRGDIKPPSIANIFLLLRFGSPAFSLTSSIESPRRRPILGRP
ncbi:hypothetical protein ETB97_011706 [Aspergillus alliaceus]|uniref:Alpha-acetolactate decarboxylase n=1 Tax=Petromyces alliaceus TaxID=209559 RepID=A0A8H6A689_PETAA|nr:hypothetical protein ETB97_011706 [Aspergillus burnettii]